MRSSVLVQSSWDTESDAGSANGRRADLKVAAEEVRSIAHAPQTGSSRFGGVVGLEAYAIIADGELYPSILLAEPDFNAPRASVLLDIDQGFLGNSKESHFGGRRDGKIHLEMYIGGDATLTTEALHMLLQRRHQPQLIEHRRTQIVYETANVGGGLADQFVHVLQFGSQRGSRPRPG
jgi:hypothetical protein